LHYVVTKLESTSKARWILGSNNKIRNHVILDYDVV